MIFPKQILLVFCNLFWSIFEHFCSDWFFGINTEDQANCGPMFLTRIYIEAEISTVKPIPPIKLPSSAPKPPIRNWHYLKNTKKHGPSICTKKNCTNITTFNNNLYCSSKCSSMAIYEKQEELFNLGEINIIQKYSDIIDKLRLILQKAKIFLEM